MGGTGASGDAARRDAPVRSIAIIGAGGMARDALHVLDALGLGAKLAGFFESAAVWRPRRVGGLPVLSLDTLDTGAMDLVVAVGSGNAREAIIGSLPSEARYPSYLHPSVLVGRNVGIGAGTLVCAGSILTCDIEVGEHVQLNIGTYVTHDCVLGALVTTGPGVRISGNCTIGRRAYIGTNACLRERTRVGDDAVVGMGAVVVADIDGGVWVGNPARRLR